MLKLRSATGLIVSIWFDIYEKSRPLRAQYPDDLNACQYLIDKLSPELQKQVYAELEVFDMFMVENHRAPTKEEAEQLIRDFLPQYA